MTAMSRTPQQTDTDALDEDDLPAIQELTDAEWYEMFDHQARRRLGISGEEFRCRFQARDFPEMDTSNIQILAMLMIDPPEQP